MLSQYLQREHATELLATQPGGLGYPLKQRIADMPTFCADLKRACAGDTVLDPEVVALMVARARHDGDDLSRLTDRQLEVVALMAAGRGNTFIARALGVSEKAVVQHVSHLFDTLGLLEGADDHRRVLAVVRRHGLCWRPMQRTRHF